MQDSERTFCACKKCQAGCRSLPGYLVPDDLPNFDKKDLAQSEGAVVIYEGERMNIPTIVPKTNERGECVFFESGRCTVHDHSPFGCRMFSVCDESDDREHLRHIGLEQIFQNKEYLATLVQLEHAAPRQERLDRLKAMIRKIERKKNDR